MLKKILKLLKVLFNNIFSLPIIYLLLIFLFNHLFSKSATAMEANNIDFYQDGEVSKLEVHLNAEGVKAKRFHLIEDKQIILDMEGVSATDRVMRAFDTSEFPGSVVFVSPYKKPGSKGDLRIAIQLRD